MHYASAREISAGSFVAHSAHWSAHAPVGDYKVVYIAEHRARARATGCRRVRVCRGSINRTRWKREMIKCIGAFAEIMLVEVDVPVQWMPIELFKSQMYGGRFWDF